MTWGRNDRPVINVSWLQAKSYTCWLTKVTGYKYRLLSEVEWEYVARAGTKTSYYFGNTINRQQSNIDRSRVNSRKWVRLTKLFGRDIAPLGSEISAIMFVGTEPVGSYEPDKFGLFDIHGNVGEWVEDCVFDDYRNGPFNELPRVEERCSARIVRGGSWYDTPMEVMSATRMHFG